jgi:hypothetical protein
MDMACSPVCETRFAARPRASPKHQPQRNSGRILPCYATAGRAEVARLCGALGGLDLEVRRRAWVSPAAAHPRTPQTRRPAAPPRPPATCRRRMQLLGERRISGAASPAPSLLAPVAPRV